VISTSLIAFQLRQQFGKLLGGCLLDGVNKQAPAGHLSGTLADGRLAGVIRGPDSKRWAWPAPQTYR